MVVFYSVVFFFLVIMVAPFLLGQLFWIVSCNAGCIRVLCCLFV